MDTDHIALPQLRPGYRRVGSGGWTQAASWKRADHPGQFLDRSELPRHSLVNLTNCVVSRRR